MQIGRFDPEAVLSTARGEKRSKDKNINTKWKSGFKSKPLFYYQLIINFCPFCAIFTVSRRNNEGKLGRLDVSTPKLYLVLREGRNVQRTKI